LPAAIVSIIIIILRITSGLAVNRNERQFSYFPDEQLVWTSYLQHKIGLPARLQKQPGAVYQNAAPARYPELGFVVTCRYILYLDNIGATPVNQPTI
jgi:hypothetical protein